MSQLVTRGGYTKYIAPDRTKIDTRRLSLWSNPESGESKTPTRSIRGNSVLTRQEEGMEKYSDFKKIGSGTAGEVYRVQEKATEKIFALKKYSGTLEQSKKEYYFLKKLQHLRHFSQVHDAFEHEVKDAFGKKTLWCVVMTFHPDGDLAQRINSLKTKADVWYTNAQESQLQIIDWMLQLAEGVSAMHSLGVIHRDLKPGNIFLKNNQLIIGDFSVATENSEPVTEIGTPGYTAPEVLEGRSYEKSVDLYSIGCILLDLLTLRGPAVPFKERLEYIPEVYLKEQWKNLVKSLCHPLNVNRNRILNPRLTTIEFGSKLLRIRSSLTQPPSLRWYESLFLRKVPEIKEQTCVKSTFILTPFQKETYEMAATRDNENSRGDAYSQAEYGTYLEKVEKNFELSTKYYQLAIDQNNTEGYARMGIHLIGHGDAEKGRRYLIIAKDRGNITVLLPLADSLFFGIGGPVDYAEGFKCLKKCAENKDPEAQTCVGLCYYLGLGVEKDERASAEWYRLAIAQADEHPHSLFAQCAYNCLAKCYERGQGVTQNFQEALTLYMTVAIKHGSVHAMFRLGAAYRKGEWGLRSSKELAIFWYQMAESAGSEEATKQKDQVV